MSKAFKIRNGSNFVTTVENVTNSQDLQLTEQAALISATLKERGVRKVENCLITEFFFLAILYTMKKHSIVLFLFTFLKYDKVI